MLLLLACEVKYLFADVAVGGYSLVYKFFSWELLHIRLHIGVGFVLLRAVTTCMSVALAVVTGLGSPFTVGSSYWVLPRCVNRYLLFLLPLWAFVMDVMFFDASFFVPRAYGVASAHIGLMCFVTDLTEVGVLFHVHIVEGTVDLTFEDLPQRFSYHRVIFGTEDTHHGEV